MGSDNETGDGDQTTHYHTNVAEEEKRRLEKEIVAEASNFEKDFATLISEVYQKEDNLKRVSNKFILYFAIFVLTSLSLYSTSSVFSFVSKFFPSDFQKVIGPAILIVIEIAGGYAIYYAYKRNFISNSTGKQESKFYSEEVKNIKEKTANRLDLVVSKIRNYVPGVNKIYEDIEKGRLIQEFRITLFNSLNRYKFKIQRDIGEYILNDFTDPFNLEQEWLDKASREIADQIGTKPTLINLSYYDYKSYTKNLRNTWNSIIEDKELFSVFLRHLLETGLLESGRSVVDANEIESLQQAIKNDQLTDLTLESFRNHYTEIFKDLRKLKSDLVKIIEKYRFTNRQNVEDGVVNFMPKSVIKESWKTEALESMGSILKLSPLILKVLLSEYNDLFGDHGSWYIIRSDPNSIKSLISMLLKNGVLYVPEKFRDDKCQVDKLIDLLAPNLQNENSFSLINISERVTTSLTELCNNKKLFILSLKSRGIHMDNFDFNDYYSWIPPSFEIKEVSDYLMAQLGIKPIYSQLFYYSYLNDMKNSSIELSEIINGNLLRDLSVFLIERRVVPPLKDVEISLQIESISFILNKKGKFEPDELIKIHYWLNKVNQEYIHMFQFVSDEFDKHLPLCDFSRLSDLFIDDIDKTPEEVEEKLMHYCLQENFEGQPIKVGETDIEKSMSALYQVNNKGMVRKWACTRAYESEVATNILYLYVKSIDEYDYGILNMPKHMAQVIEEYDISSIKDEDKRYRFAHELKDGKIPNGLNKLYSEDFASIDENLQNSGVLTELNATLEEMDPQFSGSFWT